MINSEATMDIRILLVDDHTMFREGLRSLVDDLGGMKVVAEAADGIAALKQADESQPDLIIMDMAMPGLSGVETTERLLKKFPKAKVLILSMYSERPYVSKALSSGAAGYLLKSGTFDELAGAIRTVMAGQMYLSPGLVNDLVETLRNDTARSPRRSEVSSKLSSREREIFRLLAEGKSVKEIAAVLRISTKTVETHRSHIFSKLGIDNIVELVKIAIREDVISVTQ
jgi:DNA-binding NarL/FixJ family response regulator